MSTCPEKDIHSIYLDGELPSTYVEKYEAHIASCPECKQRLDKLKFLRSLLEADKNSMELSQKDMDASFERLQARLSFAKHTKKSNVVEFKPMTWVSVAAGAVAALALIVLPARLSQRGILPQTMDSSFQPVANMGIVSPALASFHQVDGEVSSKSVANLFPEGETFVGNSDVLNTFSNFGTVNYSAGDKNSYGTTASKKLSSTAMTLASYDIFTPVPNRDESGVSKSEQSQRSVEFSMTCLDLE